VLSAAVISRDSTGAGRARIGLDVSGQAFLRDHRVGPRAILSTVMSLEAMGEAALALRPGSVVSSVDELTKRRPLFVGDGEPETIEIEVVPETADVLRCRVVSDPDGARVHHDEALLTLAERLPGGRVGTSPTGATGPSVAQALIYQLFFHGPSFQIVGSAQLGEDCLTATLAPDLPPLSDARRPSAVSPRLIELCLQGAGLLELETTSRMMIPRSLDQVVRYSDVADDYGVPLRAIVRRRAGSEGEQESMVFDAALLDDADQMHLEVRGYRTAPFDQPVDDAAVAAIVTALRG
jgi:hypothetical protein